MTRWIHKDDVPLVGALLVSVLLAVLLVVMAWDGSAVYPQCQEDNVLVGRGDFSSGRWESYVCGPTEDDLVAREDVNRDGKVDVLDVQTVVNEFLRLHAGETMELPRMLVQCVVEEWDEAGVHVSLTPVACG